MCNLIVRAVRECGLKVLGLKIFFSLKIVYRKPYFFRSWATLRVLILISSEKHHLHLQIDRSSLNSGNGTPVLNDEIECRRVYLQFRMPHYAAVLYLEYQSLLALF